MFGNDDIDRDLDDMFGGPSPRDMRKMPGGMNLPPAMVMMLSTAFGGGEPIITGDEVEHNDTGKISIPTGMGYEEAMRVLRRLHHEAETIAEFKQAYDYRPDDGAVATARVLKARFGMVLGESIDMGFFGGMKPPEERTVAISHNETVTVPWGAISIPQLENLELRLCSGYDTERGELFHLHATAPKKHKGVIEEIFAAIEHELQTNSIYRGKALVGSDDLEFLDVSTFNASEIVFTDKVQTQLEAGVWSLLRYTEEFRDEGLRTKRTALLTGPFGSGKSSAGLITAQIATQNGWTFLSARPGVDDVEDVLRTAKLYMPAVVFAEDIDGKASSSDSDAVARLLDAFDGITAKGGDLVVVMTTNHPDRIHKGMLRPGRLDSVIEISSLDRESVERLVKVVVPDGKLDLAVDFDRIFAAMEGFYPAFVREAIERAKTFAVSRNRGALNYVLNTDDIVAAAESLRPQLEALEKANEGERIPELETALANAITKGTQQGVHGTRVDHHRDGMVLSVPGLNGQGHH